jgi:hypothetical protein
LTPRRARPYRRRDFAFEVPPKIGMANPALNPELGKRLRTLLCTPAADS